MDLFSKSQLTDRCIWWNLFLLDVGMHSSGKMSYHDLLLNGLSCALSEENIGNDWTVIGEVFSPHFLIPHWNLEA